MTFWTVLYNHYNQAVCGSTILVANRYKAQPRTLTVKLLTIFLGSILIPFYSFCQFTLNGISTDVQSIFYVCRGAPVVVKTSTLPSSTIRWNFNGATPASSTAPQVVVHYASPGSYQVLQEVTEGMITTQIAATVIVSDTKPEANFSVISPSSLCAGENFSFVNTSSGTGLKYKWRFGGCVVIDSSLVENPVIKFDNALGNLTTSCAVTLVATNSSGCTDTLTKQVTLKQFPDINVTDDNPNSPSTSVFRACGVTVPRTIRFENHSSTDATNVSYEVRWGNVPDTTWPANTWPLNAAGTISRSFSEGYSPSKMNITIAGKNGCIAKKTYDVYVSRLVRPVGLLTSDIAGINCSPVRRYFNFKNAGQNSPGTRYTFNVNDTSKSVIYSQPPPDSISYQITKTSCGVSSVISRVTYPNAFRALLTVSNPCGSISSSIVPIYVSGKPKASFVTTSRLCANEVVTFTNTGTFNKTVQPSSNPVSCDSSGKIVWVITPGTFTVIAGKTGSLNGSAESVNWDSGTQELKVAFTGPGNYRVKMYAGNLNCGVDSSSQTICIRNATRFRMDTPTSCVNSVVNFYNNTIAATDCISNKSVFKWDIKRLADTSNCSGAGTYSFINGTSANTLNAALRFNGAGAYQVTLTEDGDSLSKACAGTYIDTISINMAPEAIIRPVNSTCRNAPVRPSADVSNCYNSGAKKYKWTFENGFPSSSDSLDPGVIKYNRSGRFYIAFSATNNCAAVFDTVYIVVSDGPAVQPIKDTFICSDNPLGIELKSNIPNTGFSWVSDVISGVVMGNSNQLRQMNTKLNDVLVNTGTANAVVRYKLTAFEPSTDFCTGDTFILNITVTPRVKAGADMRICPGTSAQLNAVAPWAVQWNWSPANLLSNAAIPAPKTSAALTVTTPFIVQATNARGCTNSDTVLVSVLPAVDLSVTPEVGYLCIGDSIQLSARGGDRYKWSPAATLNNSLLPNPKAGPKVTTTYTVSATDSNNCSTQVSSITVNVGTHPIVDAGRGTQVPATTSVTIKPIVINGPVKSYTWTWTPPEAGSISCIDPPLCSGVLATVRDNVSFKVVVENIYGCRQADTINFTASCIKEKQLYVPTAFTPNGDGLNDIFTVRGYGFIIRHVQVYNRWGQSVYERKDIRPNDNTSGWNGKMLNGEFAAAELYLVTLELSCNDSGQLFKYKGSLSLLR